MALGRQEVSLYELQAFTGPDPLLNVFARFASSGGVQFSARVTVVADGLRFTGALGDMVEFGKSLDEGLQEGFSHYAEQQSATEAIADAEKVRDAFGGTSIGELSERARQQRTEDEKELERLLESKQEVPDDLGQRLIRHRAPAPVVLLKDAVIWGPGFMGLQRPWVRIRAAQITAWWFADADEGRPD